MTEHTIREFLQNFRLNESTTFVMNEDRWRTCADPDEMLNFLEPRASSCKLQRFAVACCRRAWHLSDDVRHRDAIEAAEGMANDLLRPADFQRITKPVVELWANIPPIVERTAFDHMTAATRHLGGGGSSRYAARFVAMGLADLAGIRDSASWIAARKSEKAIQCAMLRDIFGSPFRPFEFDSAWLRSDGAPAMEVARRIDETGQFVDLTTLADALERAGCNDRAVLDHCRAPGLHVRGCWVVDALLGRECAVYKGLTTEADWWSCEFPESLLHFLKDKGTINQWRQFAVACCRRIDHLITDERSRRALDVAERYANGSATDEDLEHARTMAQEALEEAKRTEWGTEADENFRVTPKYAAVSRDLFAVQAVRSAVCRDPRAADDDPETYWGWLWKPSHERVAAAARWDVYAKMRDDNRADEGRDERSNTMVFMAAHGKMGSSPPRASVEEAATAAELAELRAQCEILRTLFGEFLGPPGDEAEWLPCGRAAPVMEWWCKLPTPR